MRSIHKGKTPQQILDYHPHPIPQPDTEEARQARVKQRFRLEFLGSAASKLAALGKNRLGPVKQARARALVAETERVKVVMHSVPFLVEDHTRHVEAILSDLRTLIGSFAQ